MRERFVLERGPLFRSKNRCCGNFARTVSCFQRDRNRRLRWRACYYNTEFLIADEAAASLDPFAEDAFNKTLLQGHPDQGVLVISHRLSVTALTDRIYVMEHGRITECGEHRSMYSYVRLSIDRCTATYV